MLYLPVKTIDRSILQTIRGRCINDCGAGVGTESIPRTSCEVPGRVRVTAAELPIGGGGLPTLCGTLGVIAEKRENKGGRPRGETKNITHAAQLSALGHS